MIEASEGHVTVTFDGTLVTISRRPGVGKPLIEPGDHTVPLRSINSIEWKPAGRFSLGHIRFAVAGSQSAALPVAPNRDANAVAFSKKTQDDFIKLRSAIQEALSR